MWCYAGVDSIATVTSLQGVILPLLFHLRSRVSLQYSDESCETHSVSGRRRRWQGRCGIACGQTGGHAGGAAAGVQAVPIHPEASTHWNTACICGWDHRQVIHFKKESKIVEDWTLMLMHSGMLCCLFRVTSEVIKKEAFSHHLGLLARLLLTPEWTVPQCDPRLPVWPAAQLSLYRGRSAKASHGEWGQWRSWQ